MMDKESAAEMIQAKALGCLDADERKVLDEYLNLGGELPWKEYGDYQNLSALLPIILEVEIPNISVKDKVARKIYDAIAELKARKTKEDLEREPDIMYPETTVLGDQLPTEVKNEIIDENREVDRLSPDDSTTDVADKSDDIEIDKPDVMPENFEDLISKSEQSGSGRQKTASEDDKTISQSDGMEKTEEIKPVQSKYRTLLEEKSKRRTQEDIPLVKEKFIEPEKPKKKSSTGLVVDIIVYLVLLGAIAFVYLKLSSDIDQLKNEIEDLRQQQGVSLTE